MYDKSFHFSEGFFNKLVELTEGAILSDQLEEIVSQLENEASKYFFTTSSEANLLRIFTSIYDFSFFFKDLTKYPHHIEIIVAIASSSNYLTDIVVRNPEFLYRIFDQEYLSKIQGQNFFKSEAAGADRFKSFNAKLNSLRQTKKANLLRIGLADILGMADIISITEQLSFLANSILEKLFEICYIEIMSKYKLITLERKYCLCSLGKLGGNELNYSSDVDLILFYDANEIIESVNKDYQEILSEAALLFIKSSTEITDRGYIYRIDFRLRPDGKNSPLCKTITDYTKYYETRGEDWERQMLIKLDFICGDRKLYSKFYDYIQPFIYPQSFSESVKEKIREMKTNIERQNTEKDNVKTFSGGIRDIEFSVQALQMLNGGKIKSLRSPNTLKSVSLLEGHKLLKKKEGTTLNEAYIFYRRIEHFLQLIDDRQTHVITDNDELLNKISVYLHFNSPDIFRKQLQLFRNEIRAIYNDILSEDGNKPRNYFSEINFRNTARAEKNITFLRSGRGIIDRKEFDSRTIELFGAIEPIFLNFLKNSTDPDKILDNFVKIIKGTGFPSIWYNELADKKSFLNYLRICLYSQKAVDIISTGKGSEELFLSRRVYLKDPEELAGLPITDVILSLSVQHALRLITESGFSKILSEVVRHKITSIAKDFGLTYKFFIGGLGSFGYSSMSFSSDVDLIIVAGQVESNPEIQKDFQNLTLSINKELKPFAVDFKLRPEGNKSPLVWGLKDYEEYLYKRARVWEFQSLLKLNFVFGDKNMFLTFRRMIFKRIGTLTRDDTRIQIIRMYSEMQKQNLQVGGFNIKKDRGGLITIDFILQMICLSNSDTYKKCIGKTSSQILRALKDKISETDLAALKANDHFLRSAGLAIQNINSSRNSLMPSSKESGSVLADFLNIVSFEELVNKINETIKMNNSLFEKYAKG